MICSLTTCKVEVIPVCFSAILILIYKVLRICGWYWDNIQNCIPIWQDNVAGKVNTCGKSKNTRQGYLTIVKLTDFLIDFWDLTLIRPIRVLEQKGNYVKKNKNPLISHSHLITVRFSISYFQFYFWVSWPIYNKVTLFAITSSRKYNPGKTK